MRPKMMLAIALIVLGFVAFAYQGVTYTTRGKPLDLGPLQITTEESHHIPLPPVLGAIALVGGVALLLVDGKRLGSSA